MKAYCFLKKQEKNKKQVPQNVKNPTPRTEEKRGQCFTNIGYR